MDRKDKWRWRFLAFESVVEGRPVQTWFNALPEDDRYEITDLLEYLQKRTNRLWPDAVFDSLRGAGGISEIKIPNIRCLRDGKVRSITYRIYGYFGPVGYAHSYTFLHGTEKDVKNYKIGKQIAKGRLDELTRRTGTVHEFEFEEPIDPEAETGKTRTN